MRWIQVDPGTIFSVRHFPLSAIEDWHLLNPLQDCKQFFHSRRRFLPVIAATGNCLQLLADGPIPETDRSAALGRQSTCSPAGAEHSGSTKLPCTVLAFPRVETLCVHREDSAADIHTPLRAKCRDAQHVPEFTGDHLTVLDQD